MIDDTVWKYRSVNMPCKLKKVLNKKGAYLGMSSCGRCGDTWNWKEGHHTLFSDGSGCFPLCEECWQLLSIEERLPFYESESQSKQKRMDIRQQVLLGK